MLRRRKHDKIMHMFKRKKSTQTTEVAAGSRNAEFSFLSENDLYFDSACQSLRPTSVVKAMQKYYEEYNSCGERVRYKWGLKVDAEVTEIREKTLKFLGFSTKEFFTAFTLNTTYGLNLALSQLDGSKFSRIITSDVEHNSVFLTSMEFAKKWSIPREILSREEDGSLPDFDAKNALVVVNAVSNIDARKLENLREVAKKVRENGGFLVIDAAQTLGFYSEWFREQLKGIGADVVCFSAHKMYGPSLGVIVARKNIVEKLNVAFLGGGMVDDVRENSYDLSAKTNPDEHIHTIFEPGLQLYAEIIGFGAALDFINSRKKADYDEIERVSKKILDFLGSKKSVHVINHKTSSTISFYSDKMDAHLLAEALSSAGVMTRSGYYCAHYYLDHVKHYPPLVRLSLSFANTELDADKLIEILTKAL